jgi:hypothetical protein
MAKKMKLFLIQEVTSIVVTAIDEKDAERVAGECDWGDPGRRQMKPKEVKTLKDLPDDGWVGAIPIGRQGDNPNELNCTEILDGRLEAQQKRHSIRVTVFVDPGSEEKVKNLEAAIKVAVKKVGLEPYELG